MFSHNFHFPPNLIELINFISVVGWRVRFVFCFVYESSEKGKQSENAIRFQGKQKTLLSNSIIRRGREREKEKKKKREKHDKRRTTGGAVTLPRYPRLHDKQTSNLKLSNSSHLVAAGPEKMKTYVRGFGRLEGGWGEKSFETEQHRIHQISL